MVLVNVINISAGFGGTTSMHISPGLTEEDFDELTAELTRVIII